MTTCQTFYELSKKFSRTQWLLLVLLKMMTMMMIKLTTIVTVSTNKRVTGFYYGK